MDAQQPLHGGWVRRADIECTDIQSESKEQAKKQKSRIAKKHKQKPAAKLLFESLSGLDCNV